MNAAPGSAPMSAASVSASMNAAAISAAMPSAGTPAAVPTPAVSEPLPRPGGSRGLLLPTLGGAALASVAVAAYFLFGRSKTDPEPKPEQTPISISARGLAPPGCNDLEALAGSWVFATATTNARNESRVGMRGFFEVEITVKDCSAEATLTKVGRKGKPVFAEPKRPRASAQLTPGVGLYAFGFGGHFELKNEDGKGVPLRVTFAREGDQLVGAWRQVGERWESSGMYGVLVGEREGDPRKIRARRREQPCAIQCAAPQEIGQVDEPDAAQIDACRSSCG